MLESFCFVGPLVKIGERDGIQLFSKRFLSILGAPGMFPNIRVRISTIYS